MQVPVDSRSMPQLTCDSKKQRKLKETSTEESLTPSRCSSEVGKQCATSLFDMCIDFIADKLFLVENFVDFPDVIGQKIFQAAKSRDMFYSFANSTHCNSMSLFCEAYAEQVLSELNMAGKPWISSNLLSTLIMFNHIVKLEVCGCSLGENDKALAEVSKFPK